jgi:hypothetical protein
VEKKKNNINYLVNIDEYWMYLKTLAVVCFSAVRVRIALNFTENVRLASDDGWILFFFFAVVVVATKFQKMYICRCDSSFWFDFAFHSIPNGKT